MKTNVTIFPSVDSIRDPVELDQYVAALTGLFEEAIKASGYPSRQGQHDAPWWTEECAAGRRRWLNGDPTAEGRKRFQKAVRQAKKKYWAKAINEVKDDRDLYRIIAWHIFEPRLNTPPLAVNGIYS